MGVFVVDADVMARTRFGTSQLAEALSGLQILLTPQVQPWHRRWRDEHAAAFKARLADDEVAAAMVRAAFGNTWTADFLTVPPQAPDLTLDEELTYLEGLGDERIRADLTFVSGPLPPALGTRGLARTAADLLRWTWNHTINPEWPRRLRVLRADVVSRTARLSAEGWTGALEDIGPGVRWLGHGELQVNSYPYPPRDIRGGDLMFIAAHSRGGWVSWRLPDRFAVVYPVTGIFLTAAAPTPLALVRLLGRSRAIVLTAIENPVSTSALVAKTSLPLGSVGGHLKVLLNAGLLHQRRSGREVLYWWSPAGRALVEAATAEHPHQDTAGQSADP